MQRAGIICLCFELELTSAIVGGQKVKDGERKGGGIGSFYILESRGAEISLCV